MKQLLDDGTGPVYRQDPDVNLHMVYRRMPVCPIE
jgi:hypothetical protein